MRALGGQVHREPVLRVRKAELDRVQVAWRRREDGLEKDRDHSLTAARRQEQDADALLLEVLLDALVVVVGNVVEDHHGPLRVHRPVPDALQELLERLALVLVGDRQLEVVLPGTDGPLHGDPLATGRRQVDEDVVHLPAGLPALDVLLVPGVRRRLVGLPFYKENNLVESIPICKSNRNL